MSKTTQYDGLRIAELEAQVATALQQRATALGLLADEQSESATKSWPRVAELSNEVAELKATLLRATDDELTVIIEALREYRYRVYEPSRRVVAEALIFRFAQELLQREQHNAV